MYLSVALVVVLGLGFMGCGPHGLSAERNKTSAFHRAIMAGLENYRSDNGVYPSASALGVPATIDGQDYDVSGALMLYQALSGDGSDKIETAVTAVAASDGILNDAELPYVFWKEMPREVILKIDAGYILVDGFGHPFQYTRGGVDRVNETYDVWSFAETQPSAKIDKAAKQAAAISEKWIKNW